MDSTRPYYFGLRCLLPPVLIHRGGEPVGAAAGVAVLAGTGVAGKTARRTRSTARTLPSAAGARRQVGLALHGECDAFALQIDFHHGDLHALLHFHNVCRVFHKVVRELADVDEAVLVDADVYERAERRDIGDDARQLHADGKVGDLLHTFNERERLEFLAGIAPGLGQFGEDVVEGGQADFVGDVVFESYLFAQQLVFDEVAHVAAEVARHGIDDAVALGMHRAFVERVLGIADAQEARRLLKGLRAQARNLEQILAGLERAVGVAEGDDGFGDGRADAGDVGQELLGGGVQLHAHAVGRIDEEQHGQGLAAAPRAQKLFRDAEKLSDEGFSQLEMMAEMLKEREKQKKKEG